MIIEKEHCDGITIEKRYNENKEMVYYGETYTGTYNMNGYKVNVKYCDKEIE